ncbi:MAG TPA: YihA family ribosome biogenesis GTP-binding protein, partial [Oceanicaulis sp.]|nr:YihA family ribosome biogenesis GTP-binding protein [Oceanicaulis sp.]
EREAMIAATQAAIAKKVAAFPVIAATSSSKRLGLDALRADIADLALPEQER